VDFEHREGQTGQNTAKGVFHNQITEGCA
jgi:hypothetical protein